MIPFQILTSGVLKYILILSSDLHLCSSSFQAQILFAFLVYPMFSSCRVHVTTLDLVVLRIFDEGYKS